MNAQLKSTFLKAVVPAVIGIAVGIYFKLTVVQ